MGGGGGGRCEEWPLRSKKCIDARLPGTGMFRGGFLERWAGCLGGLIGDWGFELGSVLVGLLSEMMLPRVLGG